MAGATYLGGPITGELVVALSFDGRAYRSLALVFLILETQNDYVRFHGKFLIHVHTLYFATRYIVQGRDHLVARYPRACGKRRP
jgi:hypothetical protein